LRKGFVEKWSRKTYKVKIDVIKELEAPIRVTGDDRVGKAFENNSSYSRSSSIP